jgi:hypothetical protein
MISSRKRSPKPLPSVIHFRAVQSISPPPTPPSCSDCASKTQPAGGGQPTESQSRMWRSSSGNVRVDTPQMSVISLPANQQTVLLDHLKKEATVIPMMPAMGSSGAAGGGGPQGAAPQAPPVKVEDLGKSMIEGHEVEGKRYTLPPPPAFQKPKMPEIPQMPKPPNMPPDAKLPHAKLPQAKMPESPKPPQPPKPPEMLKPPQPTVTEIWSSVKLKTPVLTKIISSAGERTTYCKPTSEQEPHPSIFQIPPGYKLKSS